MLAAAPLVFELFTTACVGAGAAAVAQPASLDAKDDGGPAVASSTPEWNRVAGVSLGGHDSSSDGSSRNKKQQKKRTVVFAFLMKDLEKNTLLARFPFKRKWSCTVAVRAFERGIPFTSPYLHQAVTNTSSHRGLKPDFPEGALFS